MYQTSYKHETELEYIPLQPIESKEKRVEGIEEYEGYTEKREPLPRRLHDAGIPDFQFKPKQVRDEEKSPKPVSKSDKFVRFK